MKKTTQPDSLAKLLAGLPEVKTIIEREQLQKKNAAIEARTRLLKELEDARAVELKAVAERDQAIEAMKPIREKLEVASASLTRAEELARIAYSKRQALEKSLNRDHGEGHVGQGTYLLRLARQGKVQLLENLRANLYLPMKHGMPFKHERPGVSKRIELVEAEIRAVDGALLKMAQLAGAAVTPDELRARVAAILESVGALPEVKELVMEQ